MVLPKFRDIFFHMGLFYARRNIVVICFCILSVALATFGFLDLKITNDPIELWVSPSSTLFQQRAAKIASFGEDFRIENLIFKPRNLPSGSQDPEYSVITKENLEEIFWFQSAIRQSVIEVGRRKLTLKDLCWQAFAKGDCVIQSPANYWQNQIERMRADTNLTETLNCIKTVDPTHSIACMDESHIPVSEKAVFGGISRRVPKSSPESADSPAPVEGSSCSDDPAADKCRTSRLYAETMSVTYLLRNELSERELYEAFELEVLQKIITAFNAAKDTSVFQQWVPNVPVRPLVLTITYVLERSIGDELVQESKQNVFIVVVSYILMFAYVSLSLGKVFSFVRSNILLALTSIGFILAAVYMGYCVCGFFDIKASLISLEVVPFLILAIGVDNLFLIHSSISGVDHPNIESKIAAGLRNISTSISLSTFTQILTFLVGLYIDIPALRSFCLTAVFSLFFNYMFQISAIPCLIAIDLTRQMSGRWDLLPFIKSKTPPNLTRPEKSHLTNFFRKVWKPMVTSWPCKALTLIIVAGTAGLFFVALSNMELGLEQQLPVLANGNLYNFFGDVKKYLEIGPIGSLIVRNADYSDATTRRVLDDLVDLISRRKDLTIPPWRVWYKTVESIRTQAVVTPHLPKICFPGVDPKPILEDFEILTDAFLRMNLDHPCCKQFGICGGQFYEDIIRKGQKIKDTRLNFFHNRLRDQQDFIKATQEIHAIVEYHRRHTPDWPKQMEVFPYSLFYVFFEQYFTIKGLTLQNYVISMLILLALVSLLFNWFVSTFLVVVVALSSMTIWTAVWASNYLFGGFPVQINAILVVNLIISVGFCVEFCIHSLIRYKRAKGDHARKMDTTVADIVSVVFQGIFLTKFIGLSVLYFSPIQLFVVYYFRVYYIMVITCGFYGLIVTPVLLDIFGPRFIRGDDSHKKSLNDYIKQQQEEREGGHSEGLLEGTGRPPFPHPGRLSSIPEEKPEDDSPMNV